MPEWKIGDRVLSTENHPDGNPDIVVGVAGTICVIDNRVGVCWDELVAGGHECAYNGKTYCPYGHGWWVDEDQIEPEPDDDVAFEFCEDEFNKLVFGK